METINKIQINGSVKTDALGNILERSTLLNIRTNDVAEAIQLFSQLKTRMDGQVETRPDRTIAQMTPDEIFPDDNACPECGNKLIQRSGRNGFFFGCKSYPNCRYTRQA